MAGPASGLSGAAVGFRATLNPNSFPYVVGGMRLSPKLEQNMWTGSELVVGIALALEREREGERESLHLSSHTGLMQVLPGHPLADTITECSVTV